MTGRPSLSSEQKNEIVQKLTPYLRAGLSIRKACLEAGVPKSSVYDYLGKDEEFTDKIRQIEQSPAIRIAMILSKHLESIEKKQDAGEDLKQDDLKFVKWYASNSRQTNEEFSKRQEIKTDFDPEQEIKRLEEIFSTHQNISNVIVN